MVSGMGVIGHLRRVRIKIQDFRCAGKTGKE